MSDSLALRVENLSKCFKLYHNPWHRALEWVSPRRKIYHQPFWALRNISFTVPRGSFLGIMGTNGSGKSTLLKILSGVTLATAGQFTMQGQVVPLLEMGVAFHGYLTGRQNVIRGAELLGFPEGYIDAYMPDILAFSELDDFIDRPVRHYSSGMRSRLTFAMIAFLACDVLILDEILTAGDIFFRQKCYARLEDLAQSDTTVILVTHRASVLTHYCSDVIVLDKGQLVYQGEPREAFRIYQDMHQRQKHQPLVLLEDDEELGTSPDAATQPGIDDDDSRQARAERVQRVGGRASNAAPLVSAEPSPAMVPTHDTRLPCAVWDTPAIFTAVPRRASNEQLWLTRFALCNAQGQATLHFTQGDTAFFYAECQLQQDIAIPIMGCEITNQWNQLIYAKNSLQHQIARPRPGKAGSLIRLCQSMTLCIQPGKYVFGLRCSTLPAASYDRLDALSDTAAQQEPTMLLHLKQLGMFHVLPRYGTGLKSLHGGLCDLPGDCQLQVLHAHE
ncbi:MAG: ABC transporter ATP-binding protein [Chloroflexaceae bacterium]|nr:ABC transporter ATP-binding protein [Chloroflexaceae bacterium]